LPTTARDKGLRILGMALLSGATDLRKGFGTSVAASGSGRLPASLACPSRESGALTSHMYTHMYV
jgi:hypothetical protein